VLDAGSVSAECALTSVLSSFIDPELTPTCEPALEMPWPLEVSKHAVYRGSCIPYDADRFLMASETVKI
jgi:hypothetical protein